MPELDVSIQPPARLRLMTTLTAVSEAEFATLRDTLQVSDSVLSNTCPRSPLSAMSTAARASTQGTAPPGYP